MLVDHLKNLNGLTNPHDSLEKIQEAAKQSPAPLLIHQESDPVIRAARDYLTPNIDKIITNESSTYERLKNYITD